jgi:hypothetical protein
MYVCSASCFCHCTTHFLVEGRHYHLPVVVLQIFSSTHRYGSTLRLTDTKDKDIYAFLGCGFCCLFRATNNRELSQIYKDIDQLEKTKMDVKRFSKRYEAYMPFALAAFVLLLSEILLRVTVLRRIP